MLLMPHSDKWRNQRKIMHSILNGQQANTKFAPYQELEAKQLVYEYLKSPERFNVANQRYANSVIMSVVFGRRAGIDDPELKAILQAVAELGEYLFNPMKNMCDAFPWLARLPKALQWWRPAGEAYFKKAISYVSTTTPPKILIVVSFPANRVFTASTKRNLTDSS